MAHLNDIARVSIKGGFYLFLGKVSSLILLTLNTIIIGRLLGPENYGLYSVVFIVPMFLITLCDLGISASLTRFSAYFRSQEKGKLASKLIKTGIIIKTTSAIIVSLFLILFSEQIAFNILKRPGIGLLIRVASINIVGQAILSALNATFIGLDEMEKSSLLNIIQASITLVSSFLLISLGKGVLGAVLGSCIGSLIGAVSGIVIYLTTSSPKLEKSDLQNEKIQFTHAIKTILYYGSPLYFSALIMSLKNPIQRILLANYNSNIEIGNYHIAVNFSFLLFTFISPIVDSLFPAFSKMSIEQNRESLEKMFKSSVKYSSLIIIPVSMALLVFSKNVVNIVYGPQYITAPTYLALYMLLYLNTALGGLVIGIFFNSQAETKTTFKISLINLSFLIPLFLIMVPRYGVIGLITSLIISQYITTFFGLFLLKRMYGLSIEWLSSLKIVVASILPALLVYTFDYLTHLNDIYNLVFGGVLFMASFLLFVPILGAIKEEDLNNLDKLLLEIPIIYQIGKFVLRLERKIIVYMRTNRWRTSLS